MGFSVSVIVTHVWIRQQQVIRQTVLVPASFTHLLHDAGGGRVQEEAAGEGPARSRGGASSQEAQGNPYTKILLFLLIKKVFRTTSDVGPYAL